MTDIVLEGFASGVCGVPDLLEAELELFADEEVIMIVLGDEVIDFGDEVAGLWDVT